VEKFSPKCVEGSSFEEEGEGYGSMAATGRSSPGLGYRAATARGDDFNIAMPLLVPHSPCAPATAVLVAAGFGSSCRVSGSLGVGLSYGLMRLPPPTVASKEAGSSGSSSLVAAPFAL
jgi:hypothetical protein